MRLGLSVWAVFWEAVGDISFSMRFRMWVNSLPKGTECVEHFAQVACVCSADGSRQHCRYDEGGANGYAYDIQVQRAKPNLRIMAYIVYVPNFYVKTFSLFCSSAIFSEFKPSITFSISSTNFLVFFITCSKSALFAWV